MKIKRIYISEMKIRKYRLIKIRKFKAQCYNKIQLNDIQERHLNLHQFKVQCYLKKNQSELAMH